MQCSSQCSLDCSSFSTALVSFPSRNLCVSKSLFREILRYFTEIGKPALQKTICGGIYAKVYCIFSALQCRRKESSRSLSHLLMSFLLSLHTCMLTINRVITLSIVSSAGYSELYHRSGARSVASRKSGAAERWAGAAEKRWSGAERSVEWEYRNRLERGVGFSLYCVYGVVFFMYGTLGHFGCICRLLVPYLLQCIIRQRAISGLDNALCALSRLVNAQLQAGERAFTEKACTLHGHPAVTSKTALIGSH